MAKKAKGDQIPTRDVIETAAWLALVGASSSASWLLFAVCELGLPDSVPANLWPGDLELDRLELETAEASGISEDDRWHLRGDGARVWISGTLCALRDGEGRLVGFAKVMRDRTDLRTQTETLERRIRELADTDAARKLFLATLGHELRNPLSALQNAARLLDLSDDGGRLRAPLDVMGRQLSLLTRLAEDLADATRADTGRLSLQCVPLSLATARC